LTARDVRNTGAFPVPRARCRRAWCLGR